MKSNDGSFHTTCIDEPLMVVTWVSHRCTWCAITNTTFSIEIYLLTLTSILGSTLYENQFNFNSEINSMKLFFPRADLLLFFFHGFNDKWVFNNVPFSPHIFFFNYVLIIKYGLQYNLLSRFQTDYIIINFSCI